MLLQLVIQVSLIALFPKILMMILILGPWSLGPDSLLGVSVEEEVFLELVIVVTRAMASGTLVSQGMDSSSVALFGVVLAL